MVNNISGININNNLLKENINDGFQEGLQNEIFSLQIAASGEEEKSHTLNEGRFLHQGAIPIPTRRDRDDDAI